jgi:hypothetical protein
MSPEWVIAIATAVGALATTVGAIATLLAVLAALGIAIWGDWLKSVTSRPKLTLAISMKAPDCHRILTTAQLPTRLVATFETYYLRLAIGNDGRAAARNVGVRAIKLFKLDAPSGAYKEDPHFMPMDLTWSHANGSVVVAKIDPKLPKHCDLAHVDQPNSTHIQINTEVTPNEVAPGVWPTVKPAGDYKLEVAVTADNSRPLYRTLKVAFDGKWYATEHDMFTKGVVVTAEDAT